jgi:hypothetical protein
LNLHGLAATRPSKGADAFHNGIVSEWLFRGVIEVDSLGEKRCGSAWCLSTKFPCARRLTKMARLPIVSWIGNAATVLMGGRGTVSRQAQLVGCSRQAVYDHAEKVEAAVRDATRGGPTRDQLQRQLREKERQVVALEKRLAEVTEFPKQEQQRFAATATAMGLSYGQTRELLEIVVKKNVPAGRRSHGG